VGEIEREEKDIRRDIEGNNTGCTTAHKQPTKQGNIASLSHTKTNQQV